MSPDENVLVVEFTEPLDANRLEAHRQEVDSWIAMGGTKVLISLGELPFVSSSAIGLLIRTRKAIESLGGHMALSRPSAFMTRALRALDLEELFNVFPTDEEALRALQTAGS